VVVLTIIHSLWNVFVLLLKRFLDFFLSNIRHDG
jgi:hypothetical protein